MPTKLKIAKILRWIARIILLLVSLFWFVFALLSGAEELGGGLKGIIMNSPNALPWLLLFVFVYVVWKWELIGGILITIFGILTILAFDTFEHLINFSLISLPLILLGIFLILSWYLTKNNKPQPYEKS